MVLYFWRYIIPDTYNYTENPPYYQCERVIDDAESVIWCERYQEPGEISLLLRATPELLDFFWELGMIITRSDSDRAMRVESIDMTTSSDNGDHIRIAGRSAESFTRDRIIMQRGRMYRTPVDAINYLIRENLGAYWYYHTDASHQHGANNPDCRRYFNLFVEGESDIGGTQEIADDAFGRNLGEVVTEYCKAHEFGFKAIFDGEKLVYSCYRGQDRTLNQSDVDAVVFADDFRNIGDSEYTRSRSDYYSHVIAGGSGTGLERVWSDAYTNYRDYKGIGGNMREDFINASGVANDALRGIASNAVLASRETYSLTAEAISGGQYKYREHYFLGDRVSAVNRYGINGTATVTEVVETEDENGMNCIPTLGQFNALEYIAPERPEKPDPPPPPPPPWYNYDQDKIAIVVLDENGNDTSNVHYESKLLSAKTYCLQLYNDAPNTKIAFYWGDDYMETMPGTSNVDLSFYYLWQTFKDAWANMIYRFKYPKSFKYYFRSVYDGLETRYDIGFISSIRTNGINGMKYNVKEVVLPKIADVDGSSSYVPIDGFKGCTSLEKLVIEDSSNIYKVGYNAFENCVSIKNIELSLLYSTYGVIEPSSFKNCTSLESITIHRVGAIHGTGTNAAFYGCDAMRAITIDNGGVTISGAPWGAEHATVIYV